MRRILVTGMSGTGKSTLIGELSARGYKAVDADSDEWSELCVESSMRWPVCNFYRSRLHFQPDAGQTAVTSGSLGGAERDGPARKRVLARKM